ncbi:MAG TPA: hypothetical protein PKC72_00785 [Chitinophagaceae bacterium]|nr:hypothetical protein [Chitinophagaceae bacterium]
MKISTFLFSLLTPAFLSAQSENDIRNYYNEVNNQIKESIENGYEGPLFNNHWIVNKNGRSWPAVGIYEGITDFWYNDTPDHIDEGQKLETVLLKVITKQRSTSYVINEEYLFQNGKLVFFYSRLDEGGDIWETRYFFNFSGKEIKEKIRFNEKDLSKKEATSDQYKDIITTPEKAINNGRKFQELFIKSM